MTGLEQIDKEWTLFLDRDGVINHESETGYILDWESFHFLDGVMDSFPIFNKFFKRIFIVTNQKGVGKGLMTEYDLLNINKCLLSVIENSGGRIDKIYYCTAIDDLDPCRKPNNGMAITAQRDFPEVLLNKALMVGNTMSDMKFGKSSGMTTVFIPSTKPSPVLPDPLVDLVFEDLTGLAKALQKSGGAK